jgi:spore maturation protein CgeB
VPILRDLAMAAAARRFEAHVRRERPDLVVVTKGTYLLPAAVRAAKRHCGHIVNLFPDGVTEVHKPGILEGLAEYDHVFMKEPYLLSRLQAAGFDNLVYLPQCCEPSVHRPLQLTAAERDRYGADVSLVGSAHSYRVASLRALPLSEFRLRLWGAGWAQAPAALAAAYAGSEVVGDAQARVFNASRINLNTAHLQDVYGVNKRTFEISGCGGFQLAPEQQDLPNLFVPGQEIVTYRDVTDLAKKIRYYLAHDDERVAIAATGQHRAHRDHTYARRVEQMLAELKL